MCYYNVKIFQFYSDLVFKALSYLSWDNTVVLNIILCYHNKSISVLHVVQSKMITVLQKQSNITQTMERSVITHLAEDYFLLHYIHVAVIQMVIMMRRNAVTIRLEHTQCVLHKHKV